jgi:hypothetical protein
VIVGIDHIVVMVADLGAATRQWSGLGFTVIPGGKHPRGTHNALVCFEDGAYLELIAFWEPDYDAHRWHRFIDSGVGLIDHALGSDDLALEVSAAGTRGIVYDGPHPGARRRPDGVELAWRTAHAADAEGNALPFLIDDVTDRALRVPTGEARRHANGVLGVETLQIVVRDLDHARDQYATLLDVQPDASAEPHSIGQESRALVLLAGEHRIELHQPVGDGLAGERLWKFGDGPYAVRFYGTRELTIDPERIDGARISSSVK